MGSCLLSLWLLRSRRLLLPILQYKPLPARSRDETVDIKRINQRLPERPRVLVSRTLNLRHTVPGQVDLVILGEIPPRVPPVEHDAVEEHQHTLEHAEEGLVAEERRQRHGIEVRVVESALGHAEVLDSPEDGADEDEHDAGVEGEQRAAERSVDGAVLRAAAVEEAGEDDEAREDDELQEERGLDERVACASFAVAETLVGGIRRAPAVQGLDDGGDEAEGREDASRVEGCMVRNVVQDPAEDVVVLQLEQRSAMILLAPT